ncbi:hypothetical protein LTR43_011914 [Exophiala xenobiotica]
MDPDGGLGNSAGSSDTEVIDYLPAPLEACLKGYFAILVPDDGPTMIAFSDFVDEMKGNPHIDTWWKRLIQVREFQEPLNLASGLSDSELEDQQAEEVQIWTGYHGFSLDPGFLPPDFGRFGWVIGASAVDEEREPVHVKLTHNGVKYQIGRRHARLSLGWNSNDPLIIARKGKAVRIDGAPIGFDLPTVLNPPQRIQIVDWTRSFSGTSSDSPTSNVLKGTPHTSLQQTPVDSQIKMQLGEYLVRFPAFACGSYGFIYGCIKREGGAAFAVKHLRRTARSDKDINNEIKIFTMVKGHVRIGSASQGNTGLTGQTAKYVRANRGHRGTSAYRCTSPRGPSERCLSNTPSAGKVGILVTYNEWIPPTPCASMLLAKRSEDSTTYTGLASSTNILFTVQAATLQVRIADYGQAIIAPTSTDHYRGTYFYMAPEVLKLKKVPNEGSPREPYNERADIHSLGIVGFKLFVFVPPTGRPVEFRPIQVAESELLDVERQRSSLRSQMLKSTALTVETCLRRMLSWEARDRPSMTEVAQLNIWPPSKPEIRSQAGQKRPRSTG